MTWPSVLAVVALLLPVFIGSWGVSVLALSVQAVCGAWIGFHHEFDSSHLGSWIALGDAALRVVLGPALLSLPSLARKEGARFELLPVNMGHWLAVGAVVFAAVALGRQIHAIDPEAPAAAITTTASCVMFAFLVLSLKGQIASQAIAILMLENGVFVFENSLEHHLPTAVQIGLSVVYVITVVCFRQALVFAAGVAKEPSA